MLGTDLVLFLALRARLACLSVAGLTYCPLVGMVASLGRRFRGCSSVDCVVRVFLPVGLRLVYRLVRSPRLLLLELFPSFMFRVAALAGLLFSSSCTCLVSSGTAASRMFECGLALSGRSGCSPLGVLPPRFPLGCLLTLWVASAAAWGLASHFSLAFSFGVVVAPWFLVGVLQRFSPPGGFLLQFFLRVPCLRSGGGGFGWLSLAGPYVLRDVFLVPVCFYPLPLLRYTGSFRRPRCACLGLRPFGKCV